MFKLESYIAPFIMGYIDQYVQLKQEDFSISLWGGDAVLNKLDLRLEAIENAVQLPITFKSGHIHELRIHVPWTNFTSESVVITINTIECVVKLRDSASDDHSSSSASVTPQKRTREGPGRQAVTREEEEDLPPGYLQGYINKILNNVNIVVNNLILKFVEDDMVLSVNVKSAELYSVNENWIRSFIELELPELVLRRVLNLHDLTVCLDKRNASGKIDTYQDPLMYRCSLTCRMYTAYDSPHAKFPSVTRINVLCDKLDLSLTDTQVPMFVRLVELCLAIYYQSLEGGEAGEEGEQKRASDIRKHIEAQTSLQDDQNSEGWGSWAWSYVPTLLTSEDDVDVTDAGSRKPRQPAILSFGAFCRKMSITFKLSEVTKASGHYAKTSFRPCVLWEAEGIGVEIVMRGVEFFSLQLGMSSTRMYCEGKAICGVLDTEDSFRDVCFLRCGGASTEQKPVHFLSQSLFDASSAENQRTRAEFITCGERYSELYTESLVLHKYGALFLDYCFTMLSDEDYVTAGESVSPGVSDGGPPGVRETSALRVIVAPAYLAVTSSMVQRLHKFIYCTTNHDYQPFITKTEDKERPRKAPTEEEVKRLEEYIPTQNMHFTLLKPHICLYSNDLPPYDVTKKQIVSHRKAKKGKSKEDAGGGTSHNGPLPALLIQAERLDVQTSTCMYPRHVVRVAAAVTSSNLLHHAHAHTHVKVFGLQVGITSVGEKGRLASVQNLLQPWSGAYYRRTLLLPHYWKNPLQPKHETVYEVPQLALHASKPQLCLLAYLADSWMAPAHAHYKLHDSSLMDDVFAGNASEAERGGAPVLELVLANCEVRQCATDATTALSATLTSAQLLLITPEHGKAVVTPLLYGPVDNSQLYQREFFQTDSAVQNDCQVDVLMCTVQLPTDTSMPTAPGVILFELQGIVGSLDPKLYDWLSYAPVKKPVTKSDSLGVTETGSAHAIDTVLADAAHPLRGGSPSESNVTNPTDGLTKTPSQTPSRTQSQTPSKPQPVAALDTSAKDEETAEVAEVKSWGRMCAEWYPFLQMVHMQVELHSCCVFAPSRAVRLDEPTMNIALNMKGLLGGGALPRTLLLCLPRLSLLSAGLKRVLPVQDLPIKLMQQSIAGEKLPWSLKLTNGCVMTLGGEDARTPPLFIVHPCSVSATLAITCTYDPPASQNIAALGACVHCNSEHIHASLSRPQVDLLYSVTMQMCDAGQKFIQSLDTVEKLSVRTASQQATSTEPPPTAPCPVLVKHGLLPSNSSQVDTVDPGAMEIQPIPTETLESDSMVSRDSPVLEEGGEGAVKLSLWLQGTLPKCEATLYCGHPGADALTKVTACVEDASASLDMHVVYTKLTGKLGAVSVTHAHRSKASDSWETGDFHGVLFTSSDVITKNTYVITHKYGRQRSTLYSPSDEQFGEASQKTDKGHTFLTLTFTRALRKNVKKRLKLADGNSHGFNGQSGFESTMDGMNYLNEVCLNIQSCDAILNYPVLVQMCEVFLLDAFTNPKPMKTAATALSERQTGANDLPFITANMLPLLYINTHKLRLFIPKICDNIARNGEAKMGANEGSVLKDCDIAVGDSAGGMSFRQKQTSAQPGDVYNTADDVDINFHNVIDDVFICEVAGVSLVPQADNPLPRLLVARDIWRRALQAGMTSQPAAELHDRQYQLDLTQWSLSTGTWRELARMSGADARSAESQNPALEWNMRTAAKGARWCCRHSDAVELVPVASGFDLRVIVAPAVTHTPPGAQPILVCGNSLEINATSDLDFFVSLDQITLAERVMRSNLEAFQKLFSSLTPVAEEKSSIDVTPRSVKHKVSSTRIYQDSGVESDLSGTQGHHANTGAGMRTIRESPPTAHTALPKGGFLPLEEQFLDPVQTAFSQASSSPRGESSFLKSQAAFSHRSSSSRDEQSLQHITTPFTVLLTAGRISMSVYKHLNDVKMEVSSPGVKEPKRKSDLEVPLEVKRSRSKRKDRASTEECSTLDSGLPEQDIPTLRKLVPVLYMFFSQPHSLMSIENHAQKLELSCYDAVMKGSKPSYGVIDVGKFIPEPSDYTVHWIDTKPGQPNPNTGIPPSLYTFRISDFLHKPAAFFMNVDRPLKLNLSLAKLDQLLLLLSDIGCVFKGKEFAKTNTGKSPSQQSSGTGKHVDLNRDENEGVNYKVDTSTSNTESCSTDEPWLWLESVLSRVERLDVSTVQLVVVMETRACSEQPFVQLSSHGLSFNVQVTPNSDNGRLKEIASKLQVNNVLLKTSLYGKSRPLIGPLSFDVTCNAEWIRHSGPNTLPQVALSLDSGVVPINVGQAHVLCLQLLAKHYQSYIQEKSENVKPSNESLNQSISRGGVVTSARAVSLRQEATESSDDDLRSGVLNYVTLETSIDELPEKGEILFSNDFTRGQAAVTWAYTSARVVTHVCSNPLPFNLPPRARDLHVDESLTVPCVLQAWDSLNQEFKDYAHFEVSEHKSCDLSLPPVTMDTRVNVIAAHIWRVLIHRPAGTDFNPDRPNEGERALFIEPLLSPLSLAASLQVKSCFSHHLVPMLTARLRAEHIRIQLTNHYAVLGSKTPTQLAPFSLDEAALSGDQQVLAVTVQAPVVTGRYFEGREQAAQAKAIANIGASIVEYRDLCMLPLIEPFDLDVRANWVKVKSKPAALTGSVWLDPITMRVAPSMINTLNTTTRCWQQMDPKAPSEVAVGEHYLICNDTQESLSVSQAESQSPGQPEESIMVASRACVPYTWRSHRGVQMLRVGLPRMAGVWTRPISIDTEGKTVHTLTARDGDTATLIVSVTPLTNVHMQVTISGGLVISNLVTQQLDIKVLTTCHDRSDKVITLDPKVTLPSFVLEPRQVKAVKIRLGGQKVLWSQELSLSGGAEKQEQAKLIKIPSQDSVTLIHVWCQVVRRPVLAATQTHVIFTPLFVFQSHLPAPLLVSMETPRLKAHRRQELNGRGAETQLHTLSGDMTHSFTFQLSDDMKPSRPAIQLNADMIEQVLRQPLSDVTDLLQPPGQPAWPYNQDTASDLGKSPSTPATAATTRPAPMPSQQDVSLASKTLPGEKATKQPNIDLQVTLRQWRPGSRTVLVDVAPHLLLCNKVAVDLWVIANGEAHWKLPANQEWAPLMFEGAFRLGLVVENELQLSGECTLSGEDNQARYLPTVPGLLYLHGHVRVAIPVSLRGRLHKMCYLSLHSTMRNNMRIVTIREAYCVTSALPHDVTIMAYDVPLSLDKTIANFSDTSLQQTINAQNDCFTKAQPVLFWNILQPPSDPDAREDETTSLDADLVHYLLIRKSDSNDNSQQQDTKDSLEVKSDWSNPLLWSCPMRIKVNESGGSRQNVALPVIEGCQGEEWEHWGAQLLSVSTCCERDVTYVSLSQDAHAHIMLHNHTPYALHFGQSYSDDMQPELCVYEEVELVSRLPLVLQYSTACYTPPALNSRFPHSMDTSEQLKLHFASCAHVTRAIATDYTGSGVEPCDHIAHALSWSHGVQMTSDSQCCIAVPGFSDLKVHCERHGHTTHLYLDPISRAEISAKEVRMRLKGGQETVKVITESPPKQIKVTSESKDERANIDMKHMESQGLGAKMESKARLESGSEDDRRKLQETVQKLHTEKKRQFTNVAKSKESALAINCNILLKRVCLILLKEDIGMDSDKSVSGISYRECVRVTADNCVMVLYPHTLNIAQLTSYTPFQNYGLSFVIGDLQLDNQMQKFGKYDFPVILHHQDGFQCQNVDKDFFELLLADKLELTRKQGFLSVEFTLCSDTQMGLTVEYVKARVAPLQLFVEDTFVYDLLKVIDTLMPVSLTTHTSRDASKSINAVPLDIQMTLAQYSYPIRLQHIVIEPITMDLSVHASLKLFIASDHSPLRFSRFERSHVFLSSSQLARTITMHFASGAIFRAGWVVGSLELLGNPTGLVRSVGAGVADLVTLPYDALTRGPGAFLAGVTRGVSSLVRNTTSGTLTSITNLASSVSRNMERLSLDAEHVQRQEATRRQRPAGLSQGLFNGLTGFGLSLLGAIAGLADQPLQTFVRPSDQPTETTPSQRATGLVSGVGKGVLGAVTKPLGGAAELVSQTGLGLLQGAGLARYPCPRAESRAVSGEECSSGALRMNRKLLDTRICGDVIFMLPAIQCLHDDQPTSQVHYDVTISEHRLVVMTTNDVSTQHVFSLARVQCSVSRAEEGVLYVTVRGEEQEEKAEEKGKSGVQDRIQAFVQHVSRHTTLEIQDGDDKNETGESHASEHCRGAFNYKFYVDTQSGKLFMELFHLYKERNSGLGFLM